MEELNRNSNTSKYVKGRKTNKFMGYQMQSANNKETIINEEVKITDFAYTKF